MGNDALDAAVLGGGFIGRMHARIYAEHPTATLAGVIDVDGETAASVAREFGAEWWAEDAATALEDYEVDVVSVATPEAHHRGPATTALENDCTVLLEKPIAETVEDALAIGDAVAASAGTLAVGYLLRFHPEYAAVKDRIAAGDLGEVLSMRAERVRDRTMYARAARWTNTVYYLSVHDVDLMRWYTGAEVTEVHARGARALEGLDEPPVVAATLAFDDGSIGSLEANWARTPDHPAYRSDSFQLTGTDGFAEKRERANVQVTTDDGFEYEQPAEIHGRAIGALRHQIDHVLECARTGLEPMVPWTEGTRSLAVGNALRESLETGAPVAVAYPDM